MVQNQDIIIEFILELAAGRLNTRRELTGTDVELDAILTGLNMLAEELRFKYEESQKIQKKQIENLMLMNDEKMASLNNIVAGIAHAINTPLLALTVGMRAGEKNLAKISDKIDVNIFNMSVMNESLDQIRSYIGNLKSFIRFQQIRHVDYDLVAELHNILAILSFKCPSNLIVTEELAPDLPVKQNIMGAEFNQALMNILMYRMENIPENIEGLMIVKAFVKKRNIIIEISDNGNPFEEDFIDCIRKSYDFLDELHKQYLNLYISKKIIEKLDGEINFEIINKKNIVRIHL